MGDCERVAVRVGIIEEKTIASRGAIRNRKLSFWALGLAIQEIRTLANYDIKTCGYSLFMIAK